MLLIKPYLGCNLHCKYCYERFLRDKDQPRLKYDMQAIIKRMEQFKNLEMCLHGGEPTLIGKKDARTILLKEKELTGKSSIQTNGTLIDDDWIQIFKEANTNVGISYDGPGKLSDCRPGTAHLDKTFRKLVKEGVRVSTIMVICKANAGTDKRLKKLENYLLELDKLGVTGRLNPSYGGGECDLSVKRLIEVYLELAKFNMFHNFQWSPFIDIIRGLEGKSRVCTFSGCDRFHTPSATVILGDGSISNCMRTNDKEILLRHPTYMDIRDEVLISTPQQFGGCKGCKYWSACHGGCPMSAINDDWRNRTYLCPLWKSLFQFYEKVLNYFGVPMNFWGTEEAKKRMSLSGDSRSNFGHGNSSHGDSPHGDSGQGQHGDWADHGDSHNDSTNSKELKGRMSRGNPIHSDLHTDSQHGDLPHGDWADHGDN